MTDDVVDDLGHKWTTLRTIDAVRCRRCSKMVDAGDLHDVDIPCE